MDIHRKRQNLQGLQRQFSKVFQLNLAQVQLLSLSSRLFASFNAHSTTRVEKWDIDKIKEF